MRSYLPYRPYLPYLAGAGGGLVPIFSRDFTVAPLTLGANATFSRASTAYHTQPDSTLSPVLAHEVRFAGARRVQNAFRSSLDLGNTQYWTPSNSPVITTGVADPFGGNNAITLASPSGAAGRISQVVVPNTVSGAVYGISIWLRRRAGTTGDFRIYPTNSPVNIPGTSITSTWQKFFVIAACTNGGTTSYLQIQTQGDEFDVYNPAHERYSSVSDQPAESVSTGITSSAELAVNGGFDSDTVWTKGTGWTITGGTAVGTATTGNLELPIGSFAPKIGKTYRVEFDATVTSGTIRAYIGGTACGSAATGATGHVTVYGIAANTTGPFYIDGVTSFTGTIDNVTIKECDSYGTNVDGVRYYSTANGNTVNATTKIVTEATGAALTGPFTLLMEPATTNTVIQSQDFSTGWSIAAGWLAFGSGSTVNTTDVAAPDGTTTVDKLVTANIGSAITTVSRGCAKTADQTVIQSWYVKAIDANIPFVRLIGMEANTSCWFDWSTKTKSNAQSSILDYGIEASVNGFYRIWSKYVVGASGTGYPGICPSSTNSIANGYFTGNGVTGLYLWQVEVKNETVLSSIIPTTTAAVTRAIDALSYSGIAAVNETDVVDNTGTVKVPNFSAVPTPTTPVSINSITAYTLGEHWNLGPELITNGTFDTNASGWTTGSATTVTVTDGVVTLTNVGGSFGQISQVLTLEVGASYIVRVGCKGTTGGVSHRVVWDTTYLYNAIPIIDIAPIVTATATSHTLVLRIGSATAAAWASFDDVSVRKILS